MLDMIADKDTCASPMLDTFSDTQMTIGSLHSQRADVFLLAHEGITKKAFLTVIFVQVGYVQSRCK